MRKGRFKMGKKETFLELLDQQTVTELKHLAKELELNHYSKLRKQQIMEMIRDAVLVEKEMKIKFLGAMDQDLKALERAIKEEVWIEEDSFEYGYFTRLHLAFVDKKNVVHIPIEVEQEYEKLKRDTNFWDTRKRNAIIEQYAIACVNLYEIIKLDKFIKIIRTQTQRKITEEEVLAWCKVRHACRGNLLYFYQQGYLMLETYGENSFGAKEDFEEMLAKQKTKPYYIPPKDELLKYVNTIYAEENKAFHDMLAFLTKEIPMKMEEAYDICVNMQLDIRSQMTMEEVDEECASMGIVFEEPEKRKEFERLLTEMLNNTRLPEHRGHTTVEIEQLKNPRKHQEKGKKVYPNAPCPCGSGKKYKFCCGKK